LLIPDYSSSKNGVEYLLQNAVGDGIDIPEPMLTAIQAELA
jgi:hypothetical protein